ncbi:hypothetical protein C5167_012061 [Papaver somniferum]|uniref:Pro-apoptotic serine protease NMA111 n=1 Tax=Papaver somniferum TaxID=3469 RepID=A0A4Y7J0B5_PAPSO|nr:hypothetical protein C5167_012061 [Papaver somniferum]
MAAAAASFICTHQSEVEIPPILFVSKLNYLGRMLQKFSDNHCTRKSHDTHLFFSPPPVMAATRPVVAEAMFSNMEEIPVFPLYRDPVHDFGFFRYDPGALQFLNYEEIPLAPEAASVGLEIRVVGNDRGEQVSILARTIARLDRDSPEYTDEGYNDFNTFYMQAASGTKSGSSGSPVVDWQGRAVAMNAGGSFNETRKLGLKRDTEQMVRNLSPAGETGMLVVDSLVPDGPADKQLQPGDILVRVNGEVITRFLNLETVLDDSVDQNIDLFIQRGDIPLTVNLLVQDLHSITPNSFLEVSDAVIHALSYQQARNFRFKCGVVYVAKPGGAQVALEYITYSDRYRSKSVLVTVDRHECYRNDPPSETNLFTTREVGTLEPGAEAANKDMTDGFCRSVPTDQHDGGEVHSLGESNAGTKKQHLEDDASTKDIVLSNCGIREPAEERLTDIIGRGDRGGIAANASVAERVLEPTLVMEPALLRGDSVFLVGLTKSLRAKSRKSNVVDPCAALQHNSYKNWPEYMATNMEVIELDSDFGGSFSGLLSDERGFVQAIWGRFSQLAVLDRVTVGSSSLFVLLRQPFMCTGSLKKDPIRRQVLCVKGCLVGSEAAKKLETNDMVLRINKELVTCFRDVEKACQGLDVSEESHGTLSMTIFRKGQIIEVIVGTDVRDGNGTTRFVNWCGCIVQEPHAAVRALGFLPEEGDVLEKVIPAVVVLRVTTCKAFDTELEGESTATGFVVDKKRGIILTNRHVVKPGPVVVEAMFVNMEEIPVYPIYRDPVHDFGFFRYDPEAVKFLSYEEIPLAPEVASVGLEIRVVGNDSGEKVSIQAGTIARLDRDSPKYRSDGYNDFNTFYMQAASGTKGGSSGSPIVDLQGRAVAMNAGGKQNESATAYFLPLERVVRALNFIQKSKDSSGCGWKAVTIPRGTLQVTFLHKGFNETRKFGLKSDTEQMVRHASPAGETGMLVVESLVPDGPAHKQLEPGDILVRVNGVVITQFLNLETILDDSVDQKIDLFIQRGDISVQDLHSITPNSFLEVSGAVIHTLSYQQARNFRFKCGVLYVAKPGYMLSRAAVPRHAIIKKFAEKEISQMDDLIAVLSELSTGARVPLEYISHLDRRRSKSVLVTVGRHEWYGPPQIYTRDDSTGLWTARPAFPHASKFLSSSHCYKNDPPSKTSLLTISEVGTLEPRAKDAIIHRTDEPFVGGIHSLGESNVGTTKQYLEDDASIKEIVLSDHAIHEPADERLTDIRELNNTGKLGDRGGIAAYASVAERVLEPTLVMCEVKPGLLRGDSVFLVGLTNSLRAKSRKSIVVDPSAALEDDSYEGWPMYMATNMEVIELDTDFGESFSGVLSDERGFVQAIWGRFSLMKFDVRGIPIYAVSEVLDKITRLERGKLRFINGIQRPIPLLRILDAELYGILPSEARSFGLSDSWVQDLVKKDPIRRQVLRVKGCLAGSEAGKTLETNDMVLAINKELITCFRDIEKACQGLDVSEEIDGTLSMTIFRKVSASRFPAMGQEIEVIVGTDVRDGNGTTQMVNWCGCVVQEPHPAVRALGLLPEEGQCVYVSGYFYGSPARRYGLKATSWIVEVNEKLTPDLDSFVEVIKGLEHGEFVRIRTMTLNGNPEVHNLKQDLYYWPTWELKFDMETAMWRRGIIKSLDTSVH